jgi:murein tripeptide amidase MpaA
MEPWEVVGDTQGYIVADVTPLGYERLLDAGFEIEVDQRLTAQLSQANTPLPGQTAGIPGYPCYRTVEETYAFAQSIAMTYPDLAEWIDIGDSWEKAQQGGEPGHDLMVLRLTRSAVPGPKPRLFVMGAAHAREYATAELCTRFAEYLVSQYAIDADVTWLLDYHEIHLLLVANPDGRLKAEAGLSWRKNTNEQYCSPTSSSRGADLNRNFEFQWGCCGGSSADECDETYRGPAPASEPETEAIQSYARALYPDQRGDDLGSAAPVTATGVFLDIHSYGELILWPWGFSGTPAPNHAELQTLGRRFAYLNGYRPEQAVGLYPTEGTSDGFAYGELGLAAFTFELGTRPFFQGCAIFENSILPDNLQALVYAAKVARTPYLTPMGPDALDLAVSPAAALSGEAVRLKSVLDDTRYSTANGVESVQNVASAQYYIDVPPWVTTTVPVVHAMTAVDGAFDEEAEDVEGVVTTWGLGPGRHTLYLRGQDASGHWGAPSAVFLHIQGPAQDPYLRYLPMVGRSGLAAGDESR